MRGKKTLMATMLAIGLSAPLSAQTPPASPAGQPPSPVATVPTPPALPATLEGTPVFTSDGQQVGKVAKVNLQGDKNVKDVEVHSPGFFGWFSTAYVLPADKLSLKGGRLEVAMTNEQVKQTAK
jgi:sporulation protein YlmC with PRC-barrel domain